MTSLLAMPSAEAGEVPPVVQFDRAWSVGDGAAVEIAYVVTCPDPSDAANGYRHALATNYGYLEFRCSPEPQRVVLLAEGAAVAKGRPITVDATVYSPQCLYWDTSELENGEQGCWKVTRSDTARVKAGRFVPESTVDIGGRVDVTDVRRTRAGGLRLTAAFSCVEGRIFGYFTFDVRQMTRRGPTSATSPAASEVACFDESFTRTFTVPRRSIDRPFTKGDVVVSAEWVEGYEGGPWAWHSGVQRLR
ncbi:hypothetical protein G7072_06245 [Nocardioides sp. HDW12B]|uniref:hypothetical protein n=1 Tax=Nocardioides sp. HDW12B TaxID=2714939 RepID=UPI001409B6B3|nr:hypothetical protein [Nocardioides sp. HDW12B]QIK65991.1 hypothetical protein G7072_06245 [Nocardioides sp. HDW12B]